MIWNTYPIADVTDAWWEQWDELNNVHLNTHPLLTSTMARLLCKHFGGDRLIAAELMQGGEVHAQAIIAPDRSGKWAVFNPSQAPIGLVVFGRAKEDYVECFRRLMSRLPGITVAISVAAQDGPYSAFAESSHYVERSVWGTTVNVECGGGFQAYWEGRPKDLKHNLRRYFKRLKEQYGDAWSLVRYESPEEIGAAVDRYAELESRGWKGKQGTALHPDNVQGRFYRDLLQAYAGKQSAAVYELKFGDRIAAARLTVSGPTMHVILKTTYDEELSRLAPGRILLHLLLERFFQDPLMRTVEFYTRANNDTLAWATGQRNIESMILYRNKLVVALASIKQRLSTRVSGEDRTEESSPASPS